MSMRGITWLLAAWLGAGAASAGPPLPLRMVTDVPLEGRATRLDYQSYDATRHLLFIAHLGDGAVAVVDTQAQRVVANVQDIRQVHGVLAIPELGRVYATATGAHQVVAIDEARFQIVATMPGGHYPDGLAYAPEVGKLYVSDKTGTVVVIDAARNWPITTIALGTELGNVQYDPESKHIFANVQSAKELAEIDPATDRVVGRYPLPGAEGNHGLLIEPRSGLAFIACEDNAKLLVFDLHKKRVVSAESVGTDPDVLAFDPALSILYVASESGVVSMFKLEGGALRKIGEDHLASRAHSVAVAPDNHRIYLPLESVSGRPVLRVMEPKQYE
jgi:DNA-binding beta-propeller fold protein YncE